MENTKSNEIVREVYSEELANQILNPDESKTSEIKKSINSTIEKYQLLDK